MNHELTTQAEQLIETIDPRLVLVEPFNLHERLQYGVCHVRERGQERDLVFRWRVQYNRSLVDNAARALRETKVRDDTPELVRVYDGENVALLKTYMEGIPFYKIEEPISELYIPTQKLIRDFHEMGIAGLDPYLNNLLLHEGRIRLFDFDHVEFEDKNPIAYRLKVDSDLSKLKMAFEWS
jgi:hypothetical protein